MHFLLIHGSWHGAWCWHKITPRLMSAGHTAHAIDLPGRGRKAASAPLVGLDRMVAAIRQVLPQKEKTVVVAHSRYGVVASQLAELVPDRIEKTIYLASFMLPDQQLAARYFRSDKDSWIQPFIDVSKVGMWDALRPEGYREVLYHDCSNDDNALAASLLCREPLRPAITKVKLTDANYGRVPRGYIRLTKDRAVSLALQDRLLSETPVDRVESIDAGHSAYFCKPDELTDAILRISGS